MIRSRPLPTALTVLFVTAAVTACSSGPASVSVDDAMIGESNGQAAALYLTLHNGADADDALRSAACDCAEDTSLHLTDVSDGRSAMQRIDELDLPAGSTVSMTPGGTHVMLERLTRPLVAGEAVEVDLELSSGTRTVTAKVVPLNELNELVPAP